LAVGLGEAARIALEEMDSESERIKKLRDVLYERIMNGLPNVVLNGSYSSRIAGNLNLSFSYVEGESLIMSVGDLALSSGSACTSASLESSYVLRALNVEQDLEHSSIRFGIGRFTTLEDVERAADLIISSVRRLRDI
ncbi:MAG: aminotransferase class V-fold PLP-dependent enzyme, partial [Anaplasma sp.]|nr:aminotransferase class V-fold PLP-dependent enzyme [Anaplasma sp.]